MSAALCPALFVAAPASGQGKTTVTAALARLHTRQGRKVRVFKCGPDFLDPQIHTVASGAPVYNLDLGMCGSADAAWRLHAAAQEADLILVEGVMGLFDGSPSGADIARYFGIPVMAVIDAKAMAQTFGALVHGLATWQPDLPFSGVLANHVGSERHAELLRDSLRPGIAWYGALPRDEAAALPERHLGLLQAAEIADLDARLDLLADHLARTGAADRPLAVSFPEAPAPFVEPLLQGRTIAIARDAAFGFIYPANLDMLQTLGAELKFFSPLANEALPACDALWLPGGYPELHAASLAANSAWQAALQAHMAAGKPLLAECGGMMSLFETITDRDGTTHPGAGLLPGHTRMQARLAALGTQVAELPEGRLNGHTFHYSKSETPLAPLARAHTPAGSEGEAIYRLGSLTASYVHFYFPSNPVATAALFGASPD
ncbi:MULTISPECIES: cobyrinate a,c-diamide synthase [Zoogloea]|jgi:cobyrinic acid a,c-diamide synthase|uniref:Cobyrinate a,c-diamide synthase n=1 Tax=Zoogloea oleivorans TaxID=1552750 RepID=A0A6C2CXK1_9RHOO|nr:MULTISPECIES: cobyrinate a,c-diamide synthase [Zoogloea]MBT9497897.1 cobyrinate a,c-diamide synthase [Zoogloea sp.]MDD2667981.1 cobyrinate a,c-diamide synthase [Zoogloea sp.]MDY0035835.1 cobyrinate a,c-diamide synthase [Zoogloea oleivorans]TYC58506.1 cobyrinate a,c-diamide synthase [Zoogloea oleivorans]